MKERTQVDALIVGAGFGGLHLLHLLRSKGFNVKGVDMAPDIGGTWYWNNYPGARADSDFFTYQYQDPEIYKDFDFTERYPGREEMMRYFDHVEKKWNLKKDIEFNTMITEATFDDQENMWTVKSSTGATWNARFFFLCTGFASKPYIPDIKGIENFKGELYHTARWPKDKKVDVRSKRVAVIGTGDSGVQVIQESGPFVSQMTVFQRTPNNCLPIRNAKLPNPNCPGKDEMPGLFQYRRTTFVGTAMNFINKNATDVSAEERRELYEKLWTAGGGSFWLDNYQDLLFSQESNDYAYSFWAEKVRERLTSEEKKNLLAPIPPVCHFGTKQPCLESTFYEVCDQDNVEIVNVNKTPIEEITKEGWIKTSDGVTREFDMIVMATGFDSLTGSISSIQIKNGKGRILKDKWTKEGTSTVLGLGVAEFPNMFFIYGPQGPTAFANGPTSAEVQGEFVTRLLLKMKAEGKQRCEGTKEAEMNWLNTLKQIWDKTLLPHTKSWYSGANIPGKRREILAYSGGMHTYVNFLNESEQKNFQEFAIV